MKKIFIYTAILATTAFACSKLENEPVQKGDETDSDVKMVTEKVTGTRESSSKVTISNDATPAFSWTAGDNIAVHVSNGVTNKYVFTSDAGASGASTAAATASFTVAYEEGYSRDAFAIYPSTIVSASATNYGQSGQPLDVTLPSSYTLDQVTGTTSPCPMIATNTAGTGWTFKQLCGLLRLTVNDIPANTKRLEIDFDGKKVSGDFSIASTVTPGTSVIATSDDASHDFVTVTNGGENFSTSAVLNIPLPVGTYTNISVIAYNAVSGGVATLAGRISFAYTASRTKGVKKTASIETKLFSVSSTKHVVIATSNLQATTTDLGVTWVWHFATNPWDYNGDSYYSNQRINGNGTVTYNGTVDLFGWVGASNTAWEGALGTTGNAAMHGISWSNDNSDYGNVSGESLKSDWGNTINDGYVWCTLTASEWAYLIGSRPSGTTANGSGNARYTLARINTDGTPVNGMIIFPNGITVASDEATKWGNINKEIGGSMYDTWEDKATQLTTAQWVALAAKGCVFLPMAGSYRYREGSNTPVFMSGRAGAYWSSSPSGASLAYHVEISKSYVDPNYGVLSTSDRKKGHSVRLVRYMN